MMAAGACQAQQGPTFNLDIGLILWVKWNRVALAGDVNWSETNFVGTVYCGGVVEI